MVQKNGYFRVEFVSGQALCHVYPPKEGGLRCDFRELSSFLDSHGFSCNKTDLNSAVMKDEASIVQLQARNNLDFSDSMEITMDRDKTEVYGRFYPGSSQDKKINVRDIMAGLSQKQVIFGIDQDSIMDFMDHPVYCTDILLARGTPCEEGHDAYIEYYFNTTPNPKPAHNDDGSVDFHNLDVISPVHEGDLVAKLFVEDRGKPGRDVSGHEIAPHPVRPSFLSVGRNIRLSDDRTEAYSMVTGHVELVNGQVFVSNVYEVPADVDNSTGDIEYEGNVHVKGSIREGFTVNAKGDVVVDGTVEGAIVIAGGQIIIQNGVNGMNKGVLQAQGNVVSKFIENAKVYTDGYIETGSIIHSNIFAKGDVVCQDKKGFITGGTVRSGGKIEAQTIGSEMGSSTKLEIGMDPNKLHRYNELNTEISTAKTEIAKITPVVKNYDRQVEAGYQLDQKNKEYYSKMKQMLIDYKSGLDDKVKEFGELKQLMETTKNAKIIVRRDIFAGVTIICSDVSIILKEKRSFCYIEKRDGEITIQNL